MLVAWPGWAGSWQQAVTSRFATEFDTNPAMSPMYPGGVRRNVFAPGYTLAGKVGESEIKTGLAFQFARSSDKNLSPDSDSPSVYIDWMRPSDAGEFGISSRYTEIATRDAGVDATGLVPADSIRTSRALSGRWSNAMSERSSLSANGTYERVLYKGSNLVDYVTRTGDATLSYSWSDHSSSFLRMSYAEYKPLGGNFLSRFANAIYGLNWNPSDYLEFSLQMGKTKVSGQPMGTQGGGAMRYTGQRTQLSLNADRQLSPGGMGGFVKADQMRASWNYALGDHSNAGFDFSWHKNLSILQNNIRTSTRVWLQHNLNPSWMVRANYMRTVVQGGGTGSVSSNILGLSLVYSYSDF